LAGGAGTELELLRSDWQTTAAAASQTILKTIAAKRRN